LSPRRHHHHYSPPPSEPLATELTSLPAQERQNSESGEERRGEERK
jgi:hypothetical protein